MSSFLHLLTFQCITIFILLSLDYSNAGGKPIPSVNCSFHHSTMDCRGLGVTAIPQGIPENITTLDLSRNDIKQITGGVFRTSSQLTHLNLAFNTLTIIENEQLDGLWNLEILDLSNNQINDIETLAFKPIKQLKYLYITHNRFHMLNVYPSALSSLYALEHLEIDIFPEFVFDKQFLNLTKLSSINFYDVTKVRIGLKNDTFFGLGSSKIHYLNIDWKIQYLESDIFSPFKYLRSLTLNSRNTIGILEVLNSLYGLQHRDMEILNLAHNAPVALSLLPTIDAKALHYLSTICVKKLYLQKTNMYQINLHAVYNLKDKTAKCIEELDLSYNYFQTLSVIFSLRWFTALKHLSLSHDQALGTRKKREQTVPQLTSKVHMYLPKSLQYFNISYASGRNKLLNNWTFSAPSLTVFDLAYPKLFEMKYSACFGLHSLEVWNVSGFNLERPTEDMLIDMYNLTHFIACQTNLGKLVDLNFTRFFSGPKALKHVNLAANHLKSINHPFLSKHGKSMTDLILSRNSLEQIPANLLTNLSELLFLDLRNNFITMIDGDGRKLLTRYMNSSFRMYLAHNPFLCTCMHLDFLKWMKSFGDRIGDIELLTCTLQNGTIVNIVQDVLNTLNNFELRCQTYFWLEFSVWSVSILVVVLIVAVIVFRNKYTFWYYIHQIRRGYKRIPIKFTHDAFICFSHHDSEWVHGTLYTTLKEQDIEMVLYDQDFQLGSYIVDEIHDAIAKSRHIIFVVTHEFLQSEWGNYEVETAKIHAVRRKRDSLIVIMKDHLEKSEMPKSLRSIWDLVVCLKWPNIADYPTDEGFEKKSKLFFRKLLQSLSINGKGCEPTQAEGEETSTIELETGTF